MRATLLVLAALAPQDPALDPGRLELGGEGPLRNDTFLPVHVEATAALGRGDAAWTRALEGGGASAGERTAAVEAWAEALALTATGDAVPVSIDGRGPGPWPDADGTATRRIEGVEVAVLRRLALVDDDQRAIWRERVRERAERALDRAGGDPALLARVERRFPHTRAAALAALRVGDAALEEGRAAGARTWLDRARTHARAAGDERALAAAIERRSDWLAARDAARTEPAQTWARAAGLSLVRADRLEGDRRFPRPARPPLLGRTLEPGAAFPPGGGAVVQAARSLTWYDRDALLAVGGRIERLRWDDLLAGVETRPVVAPSAGGWPLLPLATGRDVIAVVGRGRPGQVARGIPRPAVGNQLVRVRRGRDGRVEPVWALGSDGLGRGGAPVRPLTDWLPLEGRYEFQPGPVLADGRVWVLARGLAHPDDEGVFGGGDVRLFVLDARDGEPLRAHHLTNAADLRSDGGIRVAADNALPTSGMPLAHHDGVVVVGTNVGLVAAFDAADGRLLWGLRNQRREPEQSGWPGSRRPLPRSAAAGTDGAAVTLTPFDSRFAYTLPLGALLGARTFVEPPRPRESVLDVVTAQGTAVYLGRHGRHQALYARAEGGELVPCLYLDDGEHFTGTAAVSPQRVIVASDRAVYLLDRGRDLYLLDALPLPDLGGGRGGGVAARDGIVLVVGGDSAWVLAAHE